MSWKGGEVVFTKHAKTKVAHIRNDTALWIQMLFWISVKDISRDGATLKNIISEGDHHEDLNAVFGTKFNPNGEIILKRINKGAEKVLLILKWVMVTLVPESVTRCHFSP